MFILSTSKYIDVNTPCILNIGATRSHSLFQSHTWMCRFELLCWLARNHWTIHTLLEHVVNGQEHQATSNQKCLIIHTFELLPICGPNLH